MINILDDKFISWISKNKNTYLLIALLIGNVYQYIDGVTDDRIHFDEEKRLNQVIQDLANKETEYERMRSEKLEFLLNALSQTKDQNGKK